MEAQIKIATLSGGVSRLPDTKRLPNEAEDLKNCVVNQEKSLLKRAPLELVEFPGTVYWDEVVDDGAFFSHIERDNDELYLIRVSDAAGDVIKIVNVLDQTTQALSTSSSATNYIGLGTSAPKDKIKLATLFDGTVFVNTEAEIRFEDDVALGGGELRYENETNDSTFVDERILLAPDTNRPGQLIDDLVLTQNVEHYGYFNNSSAPTAQDLTAWNGYESVIGTGKVWYARNSFSGNPAGFYKAISDTNQPWYERVRTQEDNSVIDRTTMPHLLFNDSIGNWSFDEIEYNPRVSGNNFTNPGPNAFSRAGSTISAATLWRNRLWFASGPTIFSSEADNLFNFFIDDADNITSTDPIDVTAATNRVANITQLVPFAEICFANTDSKVQFEVQGSNNLISPTTAAVSATSFYGTSPSTEPITLGSVLFFNDANRLYAYMPEARAALNQAEEMSYHARDFLPKNPRLATPVEFQNSLAWIDGDNPNEIYWYTARFASNQQTQSAFYRWELDAGMTVQYMFNFETYLYVVAGVDGKSYIFKVDLETLTEDPFLDCQHQVTGVYDAATRKTTFTSRVPLSENSDMRCVVMGDEWGTSAGVRVEDLGTDRNTVVVNGDYSAYPVYIGNCYEMKATLSRQYVRDEDNSVEQGQVALKTLHVLYENSGHFDIEVLRAGRELSKSLTTVDNMRVNGQIKLGDLKWVDGEYLARITGDAYHTQVSIVSDYPEPVNITQLEFAVNFEKGKKTSIKS